MVLGVRVHGDGATDADVALDHLFRAVPLAELLGVPLVYKKLPGTGGDDSHIRSNVIVRWMADPDDGLAPPEWQYGGRMGPAPPVVLARRDKLPFSQQDWRLMDAYFDEWSEALAEAEDDRAAASQQLLTPLALRDFALAHREQHPTALLWLRFPLGSTVVADGVSSAELNGREGEVSQYSRDRVGVRFDDRGVTALRPERLTLAREAPLPILEPAAKRQDTGDAKEARETRAKEVHRQETKVIASRFVECLHQDTFPEMGDLHLFGVGCEYKARAQDVLAVWQGAVKHQDLAAEELALALENESVKELFMATCHKLASSRTPNSTYAKQLIENNFAALEWDSL